MKYGTLNSDGSITEHDDVLKFAEYFETGNRKIAYTEINGVTISTVFLGIKHGDDWFETMIFPDGEYQTRCATLADAIHQHMEAIKHACS